jgi:hypothetical protein
MTQLNQPSATPVIVRIKDLRYAIVLTRGVKLRSEHPGSLLVRPSKAHAYGRLLPKRIPWSSFAPVHRKPRAKGYCKVAEQLDEPDRTKMVERKVL